MKKILTLTYHFPPYRTGGVYRHLKFTKYLDEFNWKPYILTVRNPSKKRIDPSLSKDIPNDLRIFRTKTYEMPIKTNTIFKRGIKKILNIFFMIPDEKIGWIFPAFIKAMNIMKNENITIFCTTSPPHSTHLIGLLIKKISKKKKWIVDFRDPWTQSFLKQSFYANNKLRHSIENLLEKIIVKNSDKIVVVTDSQKENLKKIYPFIENKITTITNGFDESDFPKVTNKRKTKVKNKYIITHIGRVYPGKSSSFLKAYKELILENTDFKKNCIVNFIGPSSIEHSIEVENSNLKGNVHLEGFHERDQIILDMLNSDMLLLLVGSENFWIPGKLFEYIRAKKPILIIGEIGDAAKIALKAGLGELVNHRDINGIKEKILELYLNKNIIKNPDKRFIMKFSRKNLTKEFVDLLNSL